MNLEAADTFRLLQQWEGTVTEIAESEFTAELRDLTEPATYREEATFDIAEVSTDDHPLLVPGAVFRWRINCRAMAGQHECISQLRFIRSPAWHRSDVGEVVGRARRLQALFPLTTTSG